MGLGGKTADRGVVAGIVPAFGRSDLGYSMITDYLSAYRNWHLRN
jgi:hypothetical protein